MAPTTVRKRPDVIAVASAMLVSILAMFAQLFGLRFSRACDAGEARGEMAVARIALNQERDAAGDAALGEAQSWQCEDAHSAFCLREAGEFEAIRRSRMIWSGGPDQAQNARRVEGGESRGDFFRPTSASLRTFSARGSPPSVSVR